MRCIALRASRHAAPLPFYPAAFLAIPHSRAKHPRDAASTPATAAAAATPPNPRPTRDRPADVGLRLRAALAWKLLLARLAGLSLMDRGLCAFICATPAGRRYTHALNAGIGAAVSPPFFSAAADGGASAAAADPADASPRALRDANGACVQNVAFLHFVASFALPLALLYASERRMRARFLASERLRPRVRMAEPLPWSPEAYGHWLALALLAPAAAWALFGHIAAAVVGA